MMQKLLASILTLFFLATSFFSSAIVACTPPVFTLHDIVYSSYVVYSTPAHLASSGGYINFNLTNAAVPYTTHCGAYGSRVFDFFYGEFVYQCDLPTGEGVGPGVTATFTFSEPDGTFTVNQTWICDDVEDQKSETLLGIGSGKVTLDCQTNVITNANWTIGEIYSYTSTTCKPVDLQITPTVIETINATTSSIPSSSMTNSASSTSSCSTTTLTTTGTATSVSTISTPSLTASGTANSSAIPTTTTTPPATTAPSVITAPVSSGTLSSGTMSITSSSPTTGSSNSTATTSATGPTGILTTGGASAVGGREIASGIAFIAIGVAVLFG